MKQLLAAAGIIVSGVLAAPAWALPIDKTLTVNVYAICDDFGANCASTGPVGDAYFAAEVNKIWAQAGISVGFNFVQYINSTAFSYIDDNVAGDGFYDLVMWAGHGISSTSVDMFLAHTVAGAYGEGWMGWGGLLMAMDTVMSYNGGQGRIDTVAHELGHNFGLVPTSLGGDATGHLPNDGVNDSLMSSGAYRLVPTTLADVYPDGLGYDQLSTAEINYVRQSSLLWDIVVVPEPGTLVLLVSGLAGVAVARRHRPTAYMRGVL